MLGLVVWAGRYDWRRQWWGRVLLRRRKRWWRGLLLSRHKRRRRKRRLRSRSLRIARERLLRASGEEMSMQPALKANGRDALPPPRSLIEVGERRLFEQVDLSLGLPSGGQRDGWRVPHPADRARWRGILDALHQPPREIIVVLRLPC